METKYSNDVYSTLERYIELSRRIDEYTKERLSNIRETVQDEVDRLTGKKKKRIKVTRTITESYEIEEG